MQHLYHHNLGSVRSQLVWSETLWKENKVQMGIEIPILVKSGRTLTNQLLQDDSQTQVIDSVVREHVWFSCSLSATVVSSDRKPVTILPILLPPTFSECCCESIWISWHLTGDCKHTLTVHDDSNHSTFFSERRKKKHAKKGARYKNQITFQKDHDVLKFEGCVKRGDRLSL